jgi:hypothetical protein
VPQTRVGRARLSFENRSSTPSRYTNPEALHGPSVARLLGRKALGGRLAPRRTLAPAEAGTRCGRYVRPCRSEGKESRRLRSRGKPSWRARWARRRRGCSRRSAGRTRTRWRLPPGPQLFSSFSFPLRHGRIRRPVPELPATCSYFPNSGVAETGGSQSTSKCVDARFHRQPFREVRQSALAQGLGSGGSATDRDFESVKVENVDDALRFFQIGL